MLKLEIDSQQSRSTDPCYWKKVSENESKQV